MAISDGLKDRLETIVGLRAYAYEPDNPNTPCGIIQDPDTATYLSDFDGSVELTIPILVLVSSLNSARTARLNMSEFLSSDGPSSIKAAVAEDPTLGGTVQYAQVTGFGQFQPATYGDLGYLGCQVFCEIVA